MADGVRSDGYYRWFPGDYMRDTADLSMTEDGAYRRLLDFYYSEEHLPSDLHRLYRIARALSLEEKAAVDHIVSRFFLVKKGHLFNTRAEREIKERRSFLEEQSRKGKLSGQSRRRKHKGNNTEPGKNPGSTPVEPRHEPEGEPKSNLASASASALASVSAPGTEDQERCASGKPDAPARPSKRFVIPTVEEVRTYCSTRGNAINPQKFVDSYTAKGWMIGKNHMKDWKATVRTWETRDAEEKGIAAPSGKPKTICKSNGCEKIATINGMCRKCYREIENSPFVQNIGVIK
jgi:uncharacterized protein YdaU (DUF1376 family)